MAMNPSRWVAGVRVPGRGGVRWTPLVDLAGLDAEAWNESRAATARKKLERGMEPPPIDVYVYPDLKRVSLSDGNHRLVAAREAGKPSIRVRWVIVR